jgi:hypothetical protein
MSGDRSGAQRAVLTMQGSRLAVCARPEANCVMKVDVACRLTVAGLLVLVNQNQDLTHRVPNNSLVAMLMRKSRYESNNAA